MFPCTYPSPAHQKRVADFMQVLLAWQLIASRARLADVIKVDTKTVEMADLESAISGMVADNPRSGSRVEKVTLAIGAGGADEKAEL